MLSKSDLILWFILSSPVLIAFGIESAHIRKFEVSRMIPITMLVLYPLGFPIYLSEYFSNTTDAQAGLATAIIPVYQLAIISLILVAGIIRSVFKRTFHKP